MQFLLKKYLNNVLGHIIYAGVGNAEELDWLISLEFDSLMLIEPIESVATKLQKKYNSNRVTVSNVAISPKSGAADFTLMRPEKYSTLKQEISLNKVLKNSKTKAIQPVRTLSISDLVQKISLDSNDNNTLILSINGSERACLDAVTAEELTQFSTLFIQVEMKGIFTRDSNVDGDLKSLLKSKGFYFEEAKQENVIFTNMVFKRDDMVLIRITELQSELGAAQSLIHKTKGEIATQEGESKRLSTQLEESRVETQQGQAEIEQIKVERDQDNTEREKQKSEFTAHVAELVEKNKQQEEKQTALCEKYIQLEAKLTERTRQCDEHSENYQKSKQWAESLNAELEESRIKTQQGQATIEQLKVERDQANAERKKQKISIMASNTELAEKNVEKEKQLKTLQMSYADLEVKLSERIIQCNELTELHLKNSKLEESLKVQQEESNGRIEEYINDLEKIKKQAADLGKEKVCLADQLLDFEKERDEIKIELRESKVSSNLGQKMLAKAQIDLEHLRQSYSKKMQSEQELLELVRELKEKLILASRYYFKMQKEHPELLSSISRIEVD